MGMPVAQRREAVCTHVFDGGKLFLGVQRKMLVRMVDIREQVDLLDMLVATFDAPRNQPAGLFGEVLLGVREDFFVVVF